MFLQAPKQTKSPQVLKPDYYHTVPLKPLLAMGRYLKVFWNTFKATANPERTENKTSPFIVCVSLLQSTGLTVPAVWMLDIKESP